MNLSPGQEITMKAPKNVLRGERRNGYKEQYRPFQEHLPSRTKIHLHGPHLVPADSGDAGLPVLGQTPLVTELQALGRVYWPVRRKDDWRRQAPEQFSSAAQSRVHSSCSIDGVRE